MFSNVITPEEKRARELILKVLYDTPKPLSTFELFEVGEKGNPPLMQVPMRRAILNLVDAGELVFTTDRRLTEAGSD
jgi:hypothetical protein